jgi:hypothetical protein
MFLTLAVLNHQPNVKAMKERGTGKRNWRITEMLSPEATERAIKKSV